jgi:hypothetical protein
MPQYIQKKQPNDMRLLTLRNIRVCCCLVAMLFLAGTLRAERKYVFGTSCDFLGGAAHQIGSSNLSLRPLAKGVIATYAIYPSFTLQSAGKHSTLDFNYTFLGERLQIDKPIITTSHHFTAALTSQVGKRAHLRLANTFSSVPALSILNVLQGTTEIPGGFEYTFEPELYRRSSMNDVGRVGLDVDLTKKSFLTLEGTGSYRGYEHDAALPGYLYDQWRIEGSAAFSHRHSERSTWSVKYRMYQNENENYPTVRSHSATLGSNLQLKPTVHLTLEAGPAYTEQSTLNPDYVGYYASLNLSKQVHENQVHFYYNHRPGDSTGLGTISDSHQGGFGFVLGLGRWTSFRFDASGFKQNQRLTKIFDYWGAQGALALSRVIGRHWIVSLGGSYQIYAGQYAGLNSLAYGRVFLAFGYRFPELWRFAK